MNSKVKGGRNLATLKVCNSNPPISHQELSFYVGDSSEADRQASDQKAADYWFDS